MVKIILPWLDLMGQKELKTIKLDLNKKDAYIDLIKESKLPKPFLVLLIE